MKKIETIIRPEKLEDLKEYLNGKEVYGMTVSMVSGCGKQRGRKQIYRGTEYNINLLPKMRVEIVVNDRKVDELVEGIADKVRTGEVGDGKIFISNVEEAIRIRTNERGESAI